MATTVTVTTQINRTYLKNKTKDEIIDLLIYILDTRCEADAKIEKQAAEVERLRDGIAGIMLLSDDYTRNQNERFAMISSRARKLLKGGE